jgi:hypothetical protein
MVNPWDDGFTARGARTAPLLLIVGSDADAQAKAGGGFRVGGNSDIYQLIPEGLRVDQLNLSKQFLNRPNRPEPARYPCVLNLVTDPDQHPKTLERAAKLLRGYKGRLINPPGALQRTTRDQVARRMTGIEGLRVPRIVRLHNPKPGAASAAVERARRAFPVIVRRAGTHTGRIIGVAHNVAELDAAAAGSGEFFIIEFVDFRGSDGLYRKYRLWSLGGRTIFRHMLATDNWNVHVSERKRFMLGRPDLIEEEMHLLERTDGALPPLVHKVFDDVKARMGLDFFGMDFGIAQDGQVVLFEANATMNFFPLEVHSKFNYLGRIREPAREAFTAMLGLG